MQHTLAKMLTPHQLEALNYKNHLSLTANAGSGKTFVLSKRYLQIALNEEILLRNIAAITFTDKAASELYKKIAKEVEEILSKTSDFNQRKKLESIRRQLVSANISTIHAFCIDILREFPVEAGLDANFQPIDESLSNDLVILSVEEVLKNAFNNSDDEREIKYLIRNLGSRKAFTDQLFSLIKNRKNVFEISEKIYKKSESEIADHLYSSFLELVNKLFMTRKDSIINNLKKINDKVLQINQKNLIANACIKLFEKISKTSNPEEYVNLIVNLKEQMCTKQGTIKKTGYLPGDDQKNISNEIAAAEEFFSEIKKIIIPENHREIELELSKFGKSLIHFFNKGVELYNRKKSENGYLDFEDILINTKEILKQDSVRNALSEKYKYLMIDEYQDTNEIQYQIFLPILRELKSGNLFVVGDEKQSIYMFRDAELEVFNETKKNIKDVSGSEFLLTLPDSFRMAPTICLFTNTLFENLFNEPNELYNEVGYSEIVCAREDGIKGQVEILIGSEEENSPNSETELVAKRIKNLLNEKQSEKLSWGDIAVLVRKRKAFSELEKVFSRHKIPFNVVGGTGFYQRQSIYDIYNYFSFLLDMNNDTTLVGLLRSPFFNLSDVQIFRISFEKDYRYWKKLISYCKKDNSIERIISQINENIVLSKSLDPVSLLRKIFNETAYLSVLASKPNGQQELANLEKLINLTSLFYQQGFRGLYDFVSFLKDSIESADEEAQAAVAEESDSVKIMTLHQAKGLEYKAVFLYKCDDTVQKSPVKSKQVTVDKKTGLLSGVPLNENYFSKYENAPVINIYNHIYSRKEQAESKRLFYVGVTRAKSYLFLSTTAKKNRYSSDSFMGMLSKGLPSASLDKDKIKIESSLKFLKKTNEGFEGIEKKLEIEIPIVREIDDFQLISEHKDDLITHSKLRIEDLKDTPEGEIISASKVAAFQQCPVKYQLIYDYGFSGLMKQFKEWRIDMFSKKFEFNPSEEGESLNDDGFKYYQLSAVKGRVIHKLLQKEIQENYLNEYATKCLNDELDIFEKQNYLVKNLADEIINDLERFYNSKIFNTLKSYSKYYNEFEIYCKEEDYFLYGIIDKLIIDKNRAIIIDFKTDDIKKTEISKRFDSYLPQLKFYSYITGRLFENINEFELRLIFIKHPDENLNIILKRDGLSSIKKEIKEMIINTRNNSFIKNLNHCSECNFALNKNRCIIQ